MSYPHDFDDPEGTAIAAGLLVVAALIGILWGNLFGA